MAPEPGLAGESWRRVRELFEQAMDVPPDQRKGLLDRLLEPGRDDGLRAAVEKLLGATDSDTPRARMLDQGVPTLEALEIVVPDRRIGASVGSYRLEAVLGEGGMGAVYLAMQKNPERRVALKLMQRGLASDEARRRFSYESELLARLTHPGIAQVYEAGVWETGTEVVPYFAMEFVADAMPIDRYAAAHDLDARAVARLVAAVCSAVHFGHQRGVLHRDLKPANVLVDGEGRPKIIDFGIARTLDRDAQRDLERASGLTAPGVLLGTLQYMSPEQCGGAEGPLDVRSDLHALGLILYELLARTPAYPVGGLDTLAAVQLIREHEPVPPSRAATALRGVPPELDWIVQKAIAKPRDRRYATVHALQEDLERCLANVPVDAAPPSRTYRLKKLVRRHRALVAGGAAFALALLGGTIVATVGFARASRAEHEARAESENLAETNRFLREMLAAVHPAKDGKDVRVVEILDRAAERLAGLLDAKPELSIALQNTLGVAYHALGLDQRARPILESAWAMSRARFGEQHASTATTRHNLGTVLVAMQEPDAAEEHLRAALAFRERSAGRADRETILSRAALGQLLYQRQRWEDAARELRAAYSELESGGDAAPEDVVPIGISLALALARRGEQSAAIALATQMHELARGRLPQDHPASLSATCELALLERSAGRREQAAATLVLVLESEERVFGEQHVRPATTRNNLAVVLQELGRYADAEPLLRKNLELLERGGAVRGEKVLAMRNNLGAVLERAGKAREAEELLRAALQRAERELSRDHWLRGVIQKNLGVALQRLGRQAEAESSLLAAHALLRRVLPEGDVRTKRTAEAVADLLAELGRPEEAAHWREAAK